MRDNLKLLIDPVFTSRHVSKCATFYWLRVVAEAWLGAGKNRWVYCAVPNRKSWPIDDIAVDHKRWIKVPIKYRYDRFREIWLPSDEHARMFNGWTGPFGDWDALMTTRNNGMYWRRIAEPRAPRLMKFMVLAEPFPFLPFKRTFTTGPKDSLDWRLNCLQTLTSYMVFDHVHVNAAFERDETVELAKQYLSPHSVKILAGKFDVTYPKNSIDPAYAVSEKAQLNFCQSRTMWVIYPQRLDETERRFSIVHKTLGSVYSMLVGSGMDIKMQICTNSASGLPDECQRDSSFLLVERPARSDFWKRLIDCHVFLSFSIEEGLPFGLLEAVQLGTIGVVSRARWSEDMFGKNYFGLVTNQAEAYGIIKWIYENKAEAWEKFVKWHRDYFSLSVLSRGNGKELMCRQTREYFNQMDDLVQHEEMKAELADVLNRDHRRLQVDLMNLPKLPSLRAFGEMRGKELISTPYRRLPGRWVASYILRSKYGWKSTEAPWVLERRGA